MRSVLWRFGYCRKLTEGAERFFRTLAELLRGRAKFFFPRNDSNRVRVIAHPQFQPNDSNA